MKIFPQKIIVLFDERQSEYSRHISSIIGLIGEDLLSAFFKYFYENKYNTKVTIGDGHPSKKTSKNHRKDLDRWIKVSKKSDSFYFQAEIKNWSAYAFGANSLKWNASKKEVIKSAEKNWNRFNELFNKDKNPSIRKVIFEANNIPDNTSKADALLIYWLPLKNPSNKKLNSFFEYKIQNKKRGEMKKLYIFSRSLFLREYLAKNGNKPLLLEMDETGERMNILHNYLGI